MSKTARGLVNFALSQVTTPSIYGAKGEVITQALINQWAELYPNIYTNAYIKKAYNYIGEVAQDCSGLISRYTGIIRNSEQYMSTATQRLPISQINSTHIGWAVWKEGHIGVYIGDGMVVEARGIDEGTIKVKVTSNNWTHVIQLKDIEYGRSTTKQQFQFQIKDFQKWLNSMYTKVIQDNCGALLKEDNIYGTKTRNATLCVWKYQMNKLKVGYTFDLKNRKFGPKCKKYGALSLVKTGSRGTFVYLAEGMLRAKKFYTGDLDGIAGSILDSAISDFQSANSLAVDGICGVNTWSKLFG